jgi:Dolichyl-phosphate-mannose-protein mannosyltransferase
MRLSKDKKYLFAILALYFSLTLIYSLAVPLWETPDEPSHYLSVRRFSDGSDFKPPRPSGEVNSGWSEGYLFSLYQRSQPPLYYLLSAPVMKVLSLRVLPLGAGMEFPAVRPDFSGTGNLFLHQRESIWAIPSPDIRVHLLRLFSVFLGGLTIFLIYRIARVVFPNDPAVALSAGVFAAALPQFNFITGAIGNDSLAALMGAGTLLFLVRLADKKTCPRSWDFLFLGVLTVLSLLAKFNLIFLIPLGVTVVIIKAIDASSWKVGLSGVAIMILPTIIGIAIAGVLFPGEIMIKFRILVWRLYRTTPDLMQIGHLQWMVKDIYRSFWATFGWMSIRVGWGLYLVWGLICLAGVIGWGKVIMRRKGMDNGWKRKAGILAAAIVLLLLGVIKNNLLVRQSQGRFLFPVLGAIAVLLSYGLLNLFDERVRKRAALIYAVIFLVLNLVSLFAYLIPAIYV